MMRAASLLAVALLAACSQSEKVAELPPEDPGPDRPDIRMVGSSTIQPFAERVAEAWRASGGAEVNIESTGTVAGQAAFCEGNSMNTPDIVKSSRRQTGQENAACKAKGVTEVIEVKFGSDGIVFARSKAAPAVDISINHFFPALAKTLPTSAYDCTPIPNPNKKWSDIDPSLPDAPIVVYGPPATSGTRDVFVQIAMEAGAKRIACLDAMSSTDHAAFDAAAHTIRDDGAWIDAGEDDRETVKKLDANRNAFGVFGYSFYQQNPDVVRAAAINGVEPGLETIGSGQYKLSRPLYLYIKKSHIARLPAIKDFAMAFLSEEAAGDDGYLKAIGLVPLPADQRAGYRATIQTETVMK